MHFEVHHYFERDRPIYIRSVLLQLLSLKGSWKLAETGRTPLRIPALQTQFRSLWGIWHRNKHQGNLLRRLKFEVTFNKKNYFFSSKNIISLIDSPQIMPNIALLATDDVSKKVHGSFHENVTGLGKTNICLRMEVLKQQMWRNRPLHNRKSLVSSFSFIAFKIC